MTRIYLKYKVTQAQLSYQDILALGGFDAVKETMSFGGTTVETVKVNSTYQGYAISELTGMSENPPPDGAIIGSPSFNTHDTGTEWWPSQPIDVLDGTVIPPEYHVDSGSGEPFELFSEGGSFSFEWSDFHLTLNTNIGFSPIDAMKGAISGALTTRAEALLATGIVNAFDQATTIQDALYATVGDALDVIHIGTSNLQDLSPSDFGRLSDDFFGGLEGTMKDAVADVLRTAFPYGPPPAVLDLPGMSLEADFDWHAFFSGYLVDSLSISATDVREESFTIPTTPPETISNTVATIHVDSGAPEWSDHDDLIIGTGNTTLIGGGGNDVLMVGWGNNILIGGTGDDRLLGGSGNDLAVLGEGQGNDIFYGGGGINTISYPSVSTGVVVNLATGIATGAEIDTDILFDVHNVLGSSGDDHITGDSGANELTGDRGDDALIGAGGNDTIQGGPGADALFGGFGADRLNGGADNDVVRGGGHDDKLFGGPGHDKLFGGQGDDAARGGGGEDVIRGGGGDDRLFGGPGADKLFGGPGGDVMRGGRDDDVLRGGAGDDRLLGGSGNDWLLAGQGRDVLIGGAGSDTFVYQGLAQIGKYSSRDIIRDFQPGQDKLNLSNIDANTLVGGNQDFTFIDGANFSAAGQLRYDSKVLSGDVNGDGNADFQILFANSAAVSSDDIIL